MPPSLNHGDFLFFPNPSSYRVLSSFSIMHLFKALILSAVISCVSGSIIPAKDDLVIRANTVTSSTTSSKKTTSTTSTSSVKTSKTTSPSNVKSSTSSKSASSSSTAKSTSSASKTSSVSSSSTSSLVADAACTNGPYTRSCWSDGFSIATDFDEKFPTTGKTVKYNLEITNTTMAPDGVDRLVLAVNGQYPGPTIYANWGDTLEITLKNSLQNNGTGIHWHGIRQYDSNTEDGVPGITECPLAPGDTKTYTFQATQYGTSWYHSHYSAQYGDGVFGGIVINGPATSNYDIDLGTMTINDWYYATAFQIADRIASSSTVPPPADTGLINGTMVSSSGGSYHNNTITKGKKYRLRLINTSVDNHFMVSLDNHPFTVITSDFVPIVPYTADWIFIGIGQRYDVIIEANQTVGNYWFRAEVQSGCGANNQNGNIKSIFHYSGAAGGDPTSSATTYTERCTDETSLVPYWDSFVPTGPLAANTEALDVAIDIGVNQIGGTVVTWGVNFSSFDVQWTKPILDYVLTGNSSWPASENLIELNQSSTWYYWIIQESAGIPFTVDVPHPIHLHGHDFYILGTGIGTYDQSTNGPTLNYTNPTRRDVAMLPAGGWLALAFETDNPGAWVMHCHIAWHAGEGLAVQFLESESLINSVDPISAQLTKTCDNWNAWYPSKAIYLQNDSGI